ncbi:hypothetical protein MTY22_004260 [Salmonella enterica]|nr:hypothetical protein [Salmonella enterica]ELH0791648.1 hypothetical protein [Salmonella enterica]HAK7672440.1 hypothetical protein [Salmonella enterica]
MYSIAEDKIRSARTDVRLAPILLAGYLSSSQVISLVHYIVQVRQEVA